MNVQQCSVFPALFRNFDHTVYSCKIRKHCTKHVIAILTVYQTDTILHPLLFHLWVSRGKQKQAGSSVFIGKPWMYSNNKRGQTEKRSARWWWALRLKRLAVELFLMRYWWVRSLVMIKLAVDHQRVAGALRTVCTVMRWKNRVVEWSATLHLKPWFTAFMGIDWKEQCVSANLRDGGALEAHTDESRSQPLRKSLCC